MMSVDVRAPRASGSTADVQRLAHWIPTAALALTLLLAWANFLTTGRWADQPGSLHGWRELWYGGGLLLASLAMLASLRWIGRPTRLGLPTALVFAGVGACVIVAAFLGRLPVSVWTQIPFKDDWTELFQQASNGVTLLRRGVVVGWNWWFLGGYPTSTDIAQNFGTLAFIPMTVFGEPLGYHLLHVVLFLAVPVFVWFDLRDEDRETRLVGAGLAAFFAAGYTGALGSSGDTNSLVGVFSVGLAIAGSHAARRGARWGGGVLLLGLTLGLYTHAAFAIYAGIYLTIEAVYFRDRVAFARLAVAAIIAGVVALPTHWESLRYPGYVSFNNTVYAPGAPLDWAAFVRQVYYNTEILMLPQRWFNDYRSLANIWLPVLVVSAFLPGRSRTGFYAWTAVVTQLLLRVNTSEAGAMFDRIQHMLPMLTAPAIAGFLLRSGGSRTLVTSLLVPLGLYVQTVFVPVRHVPDLRAFDPPLIDRIAASDGNMILVEVSPHRDMDSHPTRRSQTTPFDVHFEGLLPRLHGQRFYSQMIDGWVWNIFRGRVVGAGTYAGRPIEETPHDEFAAEMAHWGVKHLFVWTEESRNYLAADPRFSERWRGGRWSHFERTNADGRAVATSTGTGSLRNLDFLGADVELAGVKAGELVVVRASYYPAWRAHVRGTEVAIVDHDGQLAFRAPRDGSYTVRFEYPRYRALSLLAVCALLAGAVGLARFGLGVRS